MLRKSNTNLASFYLVLIFLYNTQSILISKLGGINIVILSLILSINFVYIFNTFLLNRTKSTKVVIVWSLFFISNILIALFSFRLNRPVYFGVFRNIVLNFSSFYTIYFFARKGYCHNRHLLYFLLFSLAGGIGIYYNTEAEILKESQNSESIVNNSSYIFVLLIPYLLLLNNKYKITSLVLVFVIAFFILFSGKRGAIIAGTISLMIYFYYSYGRNSKLSLILIFFILIGGIFLTFQLMDEKSVDFIFFRFDQMQSGEDSGRSSIYSVLLKHWYTSDNVFNLFFGFGFGNSIVTSGKLAHNDWLELLTNLGIFGVVLYIILFLVLILRISGFSLSRLEKSIGYLLVLSWFMITLYSMGYANSTGIYRTILIAYIMGRMDKIESNSILNI